MGVIIMWGFKDLSLLVSKKMPVLCFLSQLAAHTGNALFPLHTWQIHETGECMILFVQVITTHKVWSPSNKNANRKLIVALYLSVVTAMSPEIIRVVNKTGTKSELCLIKTKQETVVLFLSVVMFTRPDINLVKDNKTGMNICSSVEQNVDKF